MQYTVYMAGVCKLCSSPLYARGLCVKHYHTEYYHRFPEKCKKRTLEWQKLDRKRNPEKWKLKGRKNYLIYKDRIYAYEEKYRDKRRVQKKVIGRKKRTDIVNFLGGKCVKCGFNDSRALQIDHVNGGGHKEYKSLKSAYAFYNLIHDNPEKYQLLCANCNWIKRWTDNEIPGPGKRVVEI